MQFKIVFGLSNISTSKHLTDKIEIKHNKIKENFYL